MSTYRSSRLVMLGTTVAGAVDGDFAATMITPLAHGISLDFPGDWDDGGVTPDGVLPGVWRFRHRLIDVAPLHVLTAHDGRPLGLRLFYSLVDDVRPRQGDGDGFRLTIQDDQRVLLYIGLEITREVIRAVDVPVVDDASRVAGWEEVAAETIAGQAGSTGTSAAERELMALLDGGGSSDAVVERLRACGELRHQRYETLLPPPPRRPDRLLSARCGRARLDVDRSDTGGVVAGVQLPAIAYRKDVTAELPAMLAAMELAPLV